jgi:hypothetical protein
MSRKLSAHYIFPVSSPPLKFGKLLCEDNGEIIELTDTRGLFKEEEGLEFYDGIIVPGFMVERFQSEQALLDRMKTMQYQYPSLTLEDIIRWATLESAKKNNLDKDYGSFEIKKHPGVYLISKIDFKLMKLTEASIVKVLIPPEEMSLF